MTTIGSASPSASCPMLEAIGVAPLSSTPAADVWRSRLDGPSTRREAACWTLIVTLLAAGPCAAQIDHAEADRAFRQAAKICERDAGALWGHSLCGPMLLIEPSTRHVVASHPDGGGELRADKGVFVGQAPVTVLPANSALTWSGVSWSELTWPLPENPEARSVMLAHEMYHRIQPLLGQVRADGDNAHLDTQAGRYLIQLEWRALARALNATEPDQRREAIGDALLFRQERYRLFPAAEAAEHALEANEGLAEYTGVRLGLMTAQARLSYAVRDLSAFADAQSFVRSFAYATGPAYGLLLDDAAPTWRDKVGPRFGLDAMLAEASRVSPPDRSELGARAEQYDDGALRNSEASREAARLARIAELTVRLVDGPVLQFPLKGAGVQFNPQTLQPLGVAGTVYPKVRVSGPWGLLEVEAGGALLDWKQGLGTVSAKGLGEQRTAAPGWTLTLKPGWSIEPGARPGDYRIVAASGR